MFIYLTDDVATVYEDNGTCLFSGSWENALSHLDTFKQISLLIDLTYLDIKEDKLPSLFIWDRIRLLHHKRAELREKGDFFGTQIIKEGNESYLRYAQIPREDSLASFIIKARNRVFLVPLEANRFLKETDPYKILIYPLPNGKVRHVVFQGQRMLLSRLAHREEDLNTSLQYLSRTHPDIFEMFHVKHLEDIKPFLQFIASQGRPILRLSQIRKEWNKIGSALVALISLSWMLFEIYQGLSFKNKELNIVLTIDSLREALKQDKDSRSKRIALDHYLYLQSIKPNFLNTVEALFLILEKHKIRLIDFDWARKQFDFTLTFLTHNNLQDQLDSFLKTLKTTFPKSQIQVREAPYHSSPHEVFKGVTDEPPLSHIRVVME